MPRDLKAELGNDRIPQRTWLKMPVIGMEAEFNVYLDGVEIVPEKYWKHPSAFIDTLMLHRTKKSSQIPTGGAVYFDRGVIEVVTPVIEIAPGCTARVVRNLWEQIGFVRDQLSNWERRTSHHVRLRAYSSHYNISFEIPRREQNARRNEKKLALLLAYLLPIPVAVVGCNRRSTGVGVRPRGSRIEITVDFTPDPGLMIATATLIVGIVREVMKWDSYELSELEERGLPTVKGVVPGKHTTRKGWLTKDFHYPQSPFTSDVDARLWETDDGRTMSLRAISREIAWYFRRSIRWHSDPFSFRLLFAILERRAPSMLELIDRPAAYEDVGRLCRWGMVIHELKSYERESELLPLAKSLFAGDAIDDFITRRAEARQKYAEERAKEKSAVPPPLEAQPKSKKVISLLDEPAPARPPRAKRKPARRRAELAEGTPKRRDEYLDRRTARRAAPGNGGERRKAQRRKQDAPVPFPDRRLTRSAYEQVFLKLVSGSRLKVGRDLYTPIGMKGWYHAIFRRESDGKEKLLSIDQLLKKMKDWTA
jgi:hypothetical protein